MWGNEESVAADDVVTYDRSMEAIMLEGWCQALVLR